LANRLRPCPSFRPRCLPFAKRVDAQPKRRPPATKDMAPSGTNGRPPCRSPCDRRPRLASHRQGARPPPAEYASWSAPIRLRVRSFVGGSPSAGAAALLIPQPHQSRQGPHRQKVWHLVVRAHPTEPPTAGQAFWRTGSHRQKVWRPTKGLAPGRAGALWPDGTTPTAGQTFWRAASHRQGARPPPAEYASWSAPIRLRVRSSVGGSPSAGAAALLIPQPHQSRQGPHRQKVWHPTKGLAPGRAGALWPDGSGLSSPDDHPLRAPR
jgi:hypothetical protein